MAPRLAVGEYERRRAPRAAPKSRGWSRERTVQKKTIDRRWLPLNALRAFEGVAKHGSFTAAANALLIS